MFGFFSGSTSTKKLNEKYQTLLKQAMDAQRSGDIRLYSELTEKAELLVKEIDEIQSVDQK